MKKFGFFLTALTFALIFAGSGLFMSEAKAAKKADVTVNNDGEVIVGHYGSWELIQVVFSEEGDRIENLKTDSQNLFAFISGIYFSNDFSGDNRTNSASVDVYARAEGTYTVSFDIAGKDGKVKESISRTVTAKKSASNPVKNLLVDGESFFDDSFNEFAFFEEHAEPTVKVTMNKGFKLKKIEYAVTEKSSSEEQLGSVYKYKKIKNGEKVSFSNVPVTEGYCSSYNSVYGDELNGGRYEYAYEYGSSHFYTCTRLKITYMVTATKEVKEEYVFLYRKADTNKVSSKAKSAKAASSNAKFTDKIHINLKTEGASVPVKHSAPGDYIGNVVSSSKNCSAFVSKRNNRYSLSCSVEDGNVVNKNEQWEGTSSEISFYAVKSGTYYVTFDIYDKDGNLKDKNCKITVFANTNKAVKTITYADKDITDEMYGRPVEGLASKGKIKVALNDGYTLKKIYYSYSKKNQSVTDYGTTVTYDKKYKAVSNGKKIVLDTQPYIYEFKENTEGEYWSEYYNMNQHCYSYTTVRVVYTDKYTGTDAEEYFYIYTPAFDNVMKY